MKQIILDPYRFVSVPLSFTYIGKCTSSGAALNFGSLDAGAIQAGDLLIYMQAAIKAGLVDVTPSGFTDGNNNSVGGGDGRAKISAKKATGSEGSVTGLDGDTDKKIGLVFRPNVAFSSFAFNATAGEITSGNPTSKSVAASGTGSYPIIVYGHMGVLNATTIGSKTITPSMTEVAGVDGGHIAHYLQYASAAADLTAYDKGDDGSNNFVQCGYLTFT